MACLWDGVVKRIAAVAAALLLPALVLPAGKHSPAEHQSINVVHAERFLAAPLPSRRPQVAASRGRGRVPLARHRHRRHVVIQVAPDRGCLAVLPRHFCVAAATWANTPKARRVAACESGGNPRSVQRSGVHRGKWQADSGFVRSYASDLPWRPIETAPEWAQDVMAYRGWRARGWRPWSCAR